VESLEGLKLLAAERMDPSLEKLELLLEEGMARSLVKLGLKHLRRRTLHSLVHQCFFCK
jgi:hypothetical protein